MENKSAISLEQAIDIAFSKAEKLDTEKIDYIKSVGRILAKPVYSDVNMPPFNKSAMDGYACTKEDLGKWLDVLEVIPAGTSPSHKVTSGKCSKIMTGAPVPDGADIVFIVEQSEIDKKGKVKFTGSKTSSNICLVGEDIKNGDVVLPEGTMLKSQHIAILASAGCTNPEVFCMPKVGIISTGSELVDSQTKPQISQIRNSNGPQLLVQTQQNSCIANYYGIVKDDEKKTLEILRKSTEENDVTLISGGVSVGDFDYVPATIEELGFEILFSKLTVKPGKHTTFATKGDKYIIGLPGNPVSSFIQFEIFVKPFLYKLMDYEEKNFYLSIPLSVDFKRKRSDRDEFIPVNINNMNEALPVSYNGSAHIHAYYDAFGFMKIAKGTDKISKGEIVDVRPL